MTTPTIRDVRVLGYELQLAAVPEAVGAARRFVTCTLRSWEVGESVVETAELLTSELATNAVEQTRRVEQRTASALGGMCSGSGREFGLVSVVWVRVRLHGQAVVVEVWDGDPAPPVVQRQSLETERGRGLFLVGTLSSRWGYYWPGAGGKVVWMSLRASGSSTKETLNTY